MAPYRQRLHFVMPGEEVPPGIVAFSVAGHSSGQCACIFESRGEKVIFTGNVAHHQIYDPARPEWLFHSAMRLSSSSSRGRNRRASGPLLGERTFFPTVRPGGRRGDSQHSPSPRLSSGKRPIF